MGKVFRECRILSSTESLDKRNEFSTVSISVEHWKDNYLAKFAIDDEEEPRLVLVVMVIDNKIKYFNATGVDLASFAAGTVALSNFSPTDEQKDIIEEGIRDVNKTSFCRIC